MNDYDSDIDLAMHICHHQLYWEKKNENELDDLYTWTRSEYVEYVTEQINDIRTASKFLDCFRQATVGPSRPVRQTVTPNDQPRGPPETDDDRKINALRQEITQRFKDHLQKEKTKEVSSTSESEMPKKKIQAKAMPKKQKGTAGTVESAEASDSRSAASAARGHRRESVIRSAIGEKHQLKLRSSLKTPKPRRISLPNLRRRPMNSSGSSARLVHSVATILRLVVVLRPCFGIILAD